MSTNRRRFDGLPTELIQDISEYIDSKEDWIALRLSCRCLEEATRRIWAKVSFEKWKLDLTNYDGLEKIARFSNKFPGLAAAITHLEARYLAQTRPTCIEESAKDKIFQYGVMMMEDALRPIQNLRRLSFIFKENVDQVAGAEEHPIWYDPDRVISFHYLRHSLTILHFCRQVRGRYLRMPHDWHSQLQYPTREDRSLQWG
jgi:hypothetical protein